MQQLSTLLLRKANRSRQQESSFYYSTVFEVVAAERVTYCTTTSATLYMTFQARPQVMVGTERDNTTNYCTRRHIQGDARNRDR